MAVVKEEQDSSSHSPPKVKTEKPQKKTENMLITKKLSEQHLALFVICNDQGNSKCEKRKRATYNSLYDNEEAKSAVMKRAKGVQANLASKLPSFVKSMHPSHVSGGFWLGLPKKFCADYLPKNDTIISLEDENGKEYETKFLAEKIGLSGGWRKFSMANDLVEGDVLVFHLVRPSKFKVYIVRIQDSDEVNDALGLLKLDVCHRQMDTKKHISICEEEEGEHSEPLAEDIPQLTFEKDNHMIYSAILQPVSDQSEDDSKDPGSEIYDGIRFSESATEFKEVKHIKHFIVVVNGLAINSMLSQHLRAKYYGLCSSQNSFLHDSLLVGLNCGLVAGMISETVNIADAIRASKLTTPQDNFAVWDKTLKAFKMMGMNVGFLQARLDRLTNLASKSKRCQEARLERTNAEEEKRILELKLSEVRGRIDELDSEIDALEVNADKLDVMFQELAKAPW